MGKFVKGAWVDTIQPITNWVIDDWKDEYTILTDLLPRLHPGTPRYNMVKDRLNIITERLTTLGVI